MASNMNKNYKKQYYKNNLSRFDNQVPSSKYWNKVELKHPFKGAADWQCSHYYFWWEYLRRHEGYKKCCERGGIGGYSKLYEDFGDVHKDEFLIWWEKKKYLFVSPQPHLFSTVDPAYEHLPRSKQKYYIETAFDKRTLKTIKEFIDIRHNLSYIKIKTDTEPKYGIESRAPLRTLWEHLNVWDAKKANPTLHNAALADIAGVLVSERVNGETIAKLKAADLPFRDVERVVMRRKQLAIQRHLRIAEQYIHNVGRGRFPLRDGR
jgi:hypothetical protein